jgi:hypothetical protein
VFRTPVQKDGHSCGPIVCRTAAYICNLLPKLNMEKLPEFIEHEVEVECRSRILKELLWYYFSSIQFGNLTISGNLNSYSSLEITDKIQSQETTIKEEAKSFDDRFVSLEPHERYAMYLSSADV